MFRIAVGVLLYTVLTFQYDFGAAHRILVDVGQVEVVVAVLIVEVEAHLVGEVLQGVVGRVDGVAQALVEIVDRSSVALFQYGVVLHKRIVAVLAPPTASVAFQTRA